jgi:dihydroorotate dehydrogenase
MGLNNDGAEVVATRLSECGKLRRIGLNITKTPDAKIEGAEAVEDFVKSFNFMQFIDGVDWITLNISCPNTAEGKTFEDPAALADLLGKLTGGGQTVWLKLAPLQARSDAVAAVDGVFSVAEDFGVKTLVIANTVPDRTLDDMKSSPALLGERGGLSGPPIFSRSLPLVSEAFRRGFTVIGVGGVSSGQDAYRLIRAGASLIQLYTAMVYDGPAVFQDIHAGLERCLVLDGYSRLADLIGKDIPQGDVQNV